MIHQRGEDSRVDAGQARRWPEAHLARGWVTLAALVALVGLPAAAGDEPGLSEHCRRAAAAAANSKREPAPLARTVHRYEAPRVTLVDQEGRAVALDDALPSSAPVALNFIFTTCTTICPVMSATFAGLRTRLGRDGEGLRLVSISIDPEHDRPSVLKAYAARFAAEPAWRFYTGTAADVGRVLQAFEAAAGDKSNHRPFTLLRRANSTEWVRLDGMASTEALMRELRAAPGER